MNKQDVSKLIRGARLFMTKYSPEILTGIGIAGMATTVVLAVKATPKALQLIEEKKKEENADRLTPVDTVRATWKCYIPAAVSGVASTACIIGARTVSARRTAALAAAYQLSETALSEYREKVVDTIGEKKEKVVREAIAKDKVEKQPVTKSEVIVTERGNTLCFDALSGRYFKSDIEQINKAFNLMNRRVITEMYISLNELYDELGLDHIRIGDDIGWNTDDKLIEPDFSSQIADDGTPCIVVDFNVAPKYGFNTFS